MAIISYILAYLVYLAAYAIAISLFGETGFGLYFGTLFSSIIGGYYGAVIVGKMCYKKDGMFMNFFIPSLFLLTIGGGIWGVTQNGWSYIWEYVVTLVGLFIAFGFFAIKASYVEKREKH